VLSGAERRTLENWIKRRKTAQELALRARIVLACADGGRGPNIAALMQQQAVHIETGQVSTFPDALRSGVLTPSPAGRRVNSQSMLTTVQQRGRGVGTTGRCWDGPRNGRTVRWSMTACGQSRTRLTRTTR
jgi:hypothetical protein